ncbi:hypothetical protein AAKU67_003681 [Oxalobacteraceae bacterium GrIS 2.11]
MKKLLSILFLFSLSACASHTYSTDGNAQSAASQIQAKWVVIGEQGQATARVVTAASGCPALNQDGVTSVMQPRAVAATVAQRHISVTNAAMSSDKPAAFPVLTCEANLKPGVGSALVAGLALPVPKAQPLKILVLGDTGCRLKAEGNAFQSCNDSEKWAFATVAKTAAGFKPDLVVHVGDYQYRESACPANVSECAGSPWGFGWDTWQADLFTPAEPLLAAAPWVMARGNHESCARAGQGWWRFLNPRPVLAGRDCNVEDHDLQGDYSAPYAVPLGGGAQLIVFDSSRASNWPLTKNDPAYVIYSDQLRQVDQLAAQTDFSIFVNHHPVLGFAPVKNQAGGVDVRPGNAALQSVMQDLHPQRLFDPHVQLLLAGHVHLFEAITFETDQPMQIVSGNGGSSPDVDLPSVLPLHSTPFSEAQVAHFNSTNHSGFMTMERTSATASEWVLKSWDKNGVLLTTCMLSKEKKICS